MTGTASSERGFSLVEVMVALFVLALAGIAIVQLMQSSTRNTTAVQERAVAMLAAENLMNAAIIRPGRIESQSGRYDIGGRAFDWRLRIDNTTDADLVRLTLQVTEPDNDAVLAELQTHRRRSGS